MGRINIGDCLQKSKKVAGLTMPAWLSNPQLAVIGVSEYISLVNVIPDPHIAGIFFWGWDGVGGFKLSGQPAANMLRNWYNSPQS